jgi:hypothetical protein
VPKRKDLEREIERAEIEVGDAGRGPAVYGTTP